jgi:hypothetical protein
VDELDGADVDATGWLGGDKQRGPTVELTSYDELLLVPA